MSKVLSVTGPVESDAIGLTLPHEHVLVDFIGAEESGTHRYDRDDVVRRVSPYLREIVEIGVKTFIECTPAYLARDVLVLKRLSEATGIRFVTNTGQYKPPFLPEATFGASPEELADLWINEFENGIEGTNVHPGFVKTAVSPEPLEPVERTVISAAALTSKRTGLPIATHTGIADRAHEILDILESYEVDPTRWIFVHAQNEESPGKLNEIAERGAWIELDGLNAGSAEKHLRSLIDLLESGHTRILLSHDSGWYRVGEPDGGTINGYTYLFDHFIPMMRSNGIENSMIQSICSNNPGKAFAIRE